MEDLQGDSQMNRYVAVITKHWQGADYDPMPIDVELDNHRA